MRKIIRSMIGFCLLGSAACAHDGVLAPELAPQPESAAPVVAPASDPVALGPVSWAESIGVPRGGPEPLYIVDGVPLSR
ncbi:MAG TPA: hypothetical protein VLK84_19030, partial [Longimicrobium sp.]|nr:hypothetical protein [Longimicrobium sp.]